MLASLSKISAYFCPTVFNIPFLIRCMKKRLKKKVTFPAPFVPQMPTSGVDFLFRNIQAWGYRERYMVGSVKHEQHRLNHDKDWDLAFTSTTFLSRGYCGSHSSVWSEKGRSQKSSWTLYLQDTATLPSFEATFNIYTSLDCQ